MSSNIPKPILLFDLSMTLLFPNDIEFHGSLNKFHESNKHRNTYNVADHVHLNEDVLTFIDTHQSSLDCYIYTTGMIQNSPVIHERLARSCIDIFTVPELGFAKTDPAAYLEIAKRIKAAPSNITFIDDSQANCAAAKKAGLNTIHYVQDNKKLLKALTKTVNIDQSHLTKID